MEASPIPFVIPSEAEGSDLSLKCSPTGRGRKWDNPLGSNDKTSLAAGDYNSLMRSMQRRASGVSA